ncbi:zinc transport protein ZntB [Sesbania bispinosa]|nr:zinc transport protein ZntB [Sesbania bispinosa]
MSGQFLIEVPKKATIHNLKQLVDVREYLLPEEDNIGIVLDERLKRLKNITGKWQIKCIDAKIHMHQLL